MADHLGPWPWQLVPTIFVLGIARRPRLATLGAASSAIYSGGDYSRIDCTHGRVSEWNRCTDRPHSLGHCLCNIVGGCLDAKYLCRSCHGLYTLGVKPCLACLKILRTFQSRFFAFVGITEFFGDDTRQFGKLFHQVVRNETGSDVFKARRFFQKR